MSEKKQYSKAEMESSLLEYVDMVVRNVAIKYAQKGYRMSPHVTVTHTGLLKIMFVIPSIKKSVEYTTGYQHLLKEDVDFNEVKKLITKAIAKVNFAVNKSDKMLN